MTEPPPRIVIMGVSGCGKSTIGAALGRALGLPFIEGDALHPARNVALMAAGTPLTDADRAGWLQAVAGELERVQGSGAVVSCSALRRIYRDVLRSRAPGLRFVHLTGDPALLAQRLQARSGHYMPASLLLSQLQTLEPPQADESALVFDIAAAPERIVSEIIAALRPAGTCSAEVRTSVARPPQQFHSPPGLHVMQFTKTVLYTAADGRAQFREEALALDEGKPQARLSPLMPSRGLQLRMSPVGFRSEFHCTETPQWVFILGGQMEIGLRDGSTRVFGPGGHFYSADTLPAGAAFDPARHGHCSRQLGDEPLVTVFVRG